MTGAITWISTWVIMILLLVMVSKTGWGRAIVYYLLWLAVILLLVSHADELSSLIDTKALQLNG
jgi:hypothetical protein